MPRAGYEGEMYYGPEVPQDRIVDGFWGCPKWRNWAVQVSGLLRFEDKLPARADLCLTAWMRYQGYEGIASVMDGYGRTGPFQGLMQAARTAWSLTSAEEMLTLLHSWVANEHRNEFEETGDLFDVGEDDVDVLLVRKMVAS